MERPRFARQLEAAAEAARDFAKRYLEEPLPDAMRFRVRLNASHDANAGPHFKLYPEDASEARALETRDLDEAQVVELLWRDGWVPQWVDVMVADVVDDEVTIIDITAAGRFIDDESTLYYEKTGLGCFGVKGPFLPPDYEEGRRFSIHDSTSCWTPAELRRAWRHADKMWSLHVRGPWFDDARLRDAPALPRLRVLEILDSHVTGDGLSALARMPELLRLRLRFGDIDSFSLSELPGIDWVELEAIPEQFRQWANLRAASPTHLTLISKYRATSDAALEIPSLADLTVEMPNWPEWLKIPASLVNLSARLSEASDDEIIRLLERGPDSLETVVLRGSPVTDAVCDALRRFRRLRYVDAERTKITKPALAKLAEGRPRFRFRAGSD